MATFKCLQRLLDQIFSNYIGGESAVKWQCSNKKSGMSKYASVSTYASAIHLDFTGSPSLLRHQLGRSSWTYICVCCNTFRSHGTYFSGLINLQLYHITNNTRVTNNHFLMCDFRAPYHWNNLTFLWLGIIVMWSTITKHKVPRLCRSHCTGVLATLYQTVVKHVTQVTKQYDCFMIQAEMAEWRADML